MDLNEQGQRSQDFSMPSQMCSWLLPDFSLGIRIQTRLLSSRKGKAGRQPEQPSQPQRATNLSITFPHAAFYQPGVYL